MLVRKKVHLRKGVHNIKVVSPNVNGKIDLLTISSRRLLSDLFAAENKIVSIRQVSATAWTLKLNSTSSCLLTFEESYDPGWILVINDSLIRSIPVNGIVNGFYITRCYIHEILYIKFWPQDVFKFGWNLSTFCILLSMYSLAVGFSIERRREIKLL
ncbi:MAG TPA: hypothetical protein ENF42_01750 [Candidatus Bathyarchaeota archaeon]|nr:hypothetical protein [Candidatus Bathyarchaeota archaeon]